MSRLYHRLVLARVRCLVAGICLVVGAGQVGLLSQGPATAFPGEVYGALLLAAGLALILTAGPLRSGVLGRVLAGLTACILAGLATDFWVTIHGTTTAAILFWLAAWLVWEAVADHEC